jgi:hypothetical protein
VQHVRIRSSVILRRVARVKAWALIANSSFLSPSRSSLSPAFSGLGGTFLWRLRQDAIIKYQGLHTNLTPSALNHAVTIQQARPG